MEPPTDLSADGVRDEKVKVLRSLRQWDTPEKVAANVVEWAFEPLVPRHVDEPGGSPRSQAHAAAERRNAR